MIHYEWDVETVDQYGDIIDHHFSDRLSTMYEEELKDAIQEKTVGDIKYRLVLIRNEGDEHEGVTDRVWAYLDDSHRLPDTFDDRPNMRIPKRFHHELKKRKKILELSQDTETTGE